MITLAKNQVVTTSKIEFVEQNRPSEEQIFLMRILNGEITFKSNEEVLENLRKRLKLDK
ncbi:MULTISPECIES: hypothetical protein [Mannheimia]|uniref:Uncharacterized protein n=1 Tax=Mannheimia pernigra TaxID=111844 RepID=A0ABD7A504_9PAST|nr:MULTISPECIES: hypothetical protein [Mannheimia]QLB41341.1 hypothetical protein HV560_00920 [Mannheimia pernigra]QTM01259.1 hypothetical protein GM698_06490 [Mannheimia sp. ZY171111]